MLDSQELQAHAARIRASQVLGRSDLMNRLFDFFVECSLNGKTPKEIEIAMDVFGKDAQFEVTQDAMVRVYIHKLRRKLEDYYLGTGKDELWRLSIPRGEYRLAAETASQPADYAAQTIETEMSPESLDEPATLTAAYNPDSGPPRSWQRFAWAAAGLLLVNALVWFAVIRYDVLSNNAVATVSHSEPWRDIAAGDQPITIVLGDYYIFGELDTPSETNPESVRRLVREFNINSRNDLEHLLKERPDLADRYMDLALRYLPVSSAHALNDVAPLLQSSAGGSRQVQILLASDLTPGIIRSSHIVYIGLLSGMGILRDIVFAGSQFKIGDTYDELIDQKHDKIYVSQSSIAVHDNTRYRDYGYFSTFAGPDGKRIVVLSGTRDVALMHTAEAVSRPESLRQLTERAGAANNFEALYAVDAIDHMNLDGQLLLANKLDTQRIWAGHTIAAALHPAQ